jgi:hypothetical protein
MAIFDRATIRNPCRSRQFRFPLNTADVHPGAAHRPQISSFIGLTMQYQIILTPLSTPPQELLQIEYSKYLPEMRVLFIS